MSDPRSQRWLGKSAAPRQITEEQAERIRKFIAERYEPRWWQREVFGGRYGNDALDFLRDLGATFGIILVLISLGGWFIGEWRGAMNEGWKNPLAGVLDNVERAGEAARKRHP